MIAQTLTDAPVRMRAALVIIFAVGLVLGARLFYWQIIQMDDLSKRGTEQRNFDAPIYARRGDILTSDNVVLAKDVFHYTITAFPQGIRDPDKVATELAPILKQPRDTILAKLKSNVGSVVLARDVDQNVGGPAMDLKDRLGVTGLQIDPQPVRLYPGGAFAEHVVGYVNSQRQAAYGIEQFKDTELRGTDGRIRGSSNALRDDLIPFVLPINESAVDGAAIVLTINSGMQRVVEQELANAIRDSRSTSGSIIVMNPKTGAILALAAWPVADLNAYYDTANQDSYSNQTVNSQYEPGSVFKIFTLAAALDAGTVTTATSFDDNGSIYIGGRTIKNHDNIAPGRVSLIDVMRQSLNVEAVKMSVGLGTENFYQYVRKFGFGARTRVELAGEASGDVKFVGDGRWREVDLGTNAFGQGIAVTPMQMIAAVGAVANQGKLMRPYIVQEVRYPNGRTITANPEVVRQVIRPEIAQVVTRILSESITGESTNKAVVPGYRVAGKTGTAQIPIAGVLDPRWTIASFAGYLPADDPQFVILIKLDKPQSSEWGSQVASPLFASVAKQLVTLAGLPPDSVRQK